VKQAVEQTKKASADIDLNRLANTVDGYEPKPNYFIKSALDMELIWCPPGSFIMGPGGDDSPAHPVILTKGFYLGKYEVTQEQYEKVTGTNPSKFKGDKLPVEMVTWNDAVAFCELLLKKERSLGWKFALPTEAQWEYACRAGTRTPYSWGNSFSPKFANYKFSGFNKPTDVGSYPSNPWGFFDMHGNVHEWTADWHGPYPRSSVIDPIGPSKGSDSVCRGGSWYNPAWQLGLGFRYPRTRGEGHTTIGFRVCFQQQ